MAATNRTICHGEKPLVIRDRALVCGEPMPEARLIELTPAGLAEVSLRAFRGVPLLLSVVPSVDTSTCHAQTKHLAAALEGLGDTVHAFTVSLDLPFAQRRWLEAEGCHTMRMVSDHRYQEFGERFGVYIESLGLLTRAVFLIDRGGIVRYVDYVENISDEPEYEPLLDAFHSLVRG